jgi:AcrR family transcriptional regulator
MLDLARERGVHDMSIRTLAGAVRAAPGSLTYHYGTKDSVFATCARLLGSWLARDLEDRLEAGGWEAVFPDGGSAPSRDDAEYALRWHVWIQLSAFALDSPSVAAPVLAAEERMAGLLTGRSGPSGPRRAECSVDELALWAMFKTLAMTLLQPESTLTRDAALAAMERTVRR